MDAIICPCKGDSVFPAARYATNAQGVFECWACGARPIEGTQGAADRLTALEDAEHAASRARLDAYASVTKPLRLAKEADFEAHGDGSPDLDAAYAAFVHAVDNIHLEPAWAIASAAEDEARAALPAAALAYLPALLPGLRAAHAAGGYKAGRDLAAIIDALPEGSLPGFQGWRKVTVSPHGAWSSLREARLCYGRAVVAAADSDGRCWVTSATAESARVTAAKARNKAYHDAYEAALASVREAIDAAPCLRGTLLACYEGSSLARVCLALNGWQVREGQEGGTITPPWGGVAVGVRGALRMPRDGGAAVPT